MAGADDLIPNLPIDHAADALLSVNPVLGAVIIFEAAAIVALAWFITRLISSGRDQAVSKDRELAEAKNAHIADLKTYLNAMRDLKETVLDLANSRPRRT